MSPITQTPIPLSDEWATPRWLFDHYDRRFRFTIDACAKPWNAKCSRFITPEADGLKQHIIAEKVWCNPPYSQLAAWMERAEKNSAECGSLWICLVPCTPDRHWWSDWVVEQAADVELLTRKLLPSGRIHFEKEDGTSGRAPFASCVVIYGRGM